MTLPARPALGSWVLVAAMTAAAYLVHLAVLCAAIALAWYFDAWPFLLIAVSGAVFLGAEAIVGRHVPGFTLRPSEEPELATLIAGVADRQGFDQTLVVRVMPVPGARLGHERVEGRRTHVLDLGWPTVTMMTAAELAAVVSHELAHHRDLATVRGRMMLTARNRLIDAWSVPLLSTALLRRTRAATVATELAADADSATTMGTPTVASALLRTAEIEELFGTLVDHWCEVMTDADEYPEDLYTCARLALDDPDVIAWTRMNHDLEPQTEDPEDTHPSVRERLIRLGTKSDVERVAGEPVRVRQGDDIDRWCLEEIFELRESELRPAPIRASRPGRFDFDPEPALSDLREATGERDTRSSLLRVVERIDDDTWRELARRLSPELEDLPPDQLAQAEIAMLVNCVGTALIAPLVAAGWGRANPWLNQILAPPEGGRVNIYAEVEAALGEHDGDRVRRLVDAVDLGGTV